jgi:YD repeat-containing protein
VSVPATQYAYNDARDLVGVTLPKGNQIIYRYYADSTNYGRLKAWAKADQGSSPQLREILRYTYDQFGNTKNEATIDAMSSSGHCFSAEENCTWYDVYRERIYNANRQVTAEHIYEYTSPINCSNQGSCDLKDPLVLKHVVRAAILEQDHAREGPQELQDRR